MKKKQGGGLFKTLKGLVIKKQAIFLSHGAFSDKTVCMGIADYLAREGYICFILEWRGHGTSPKTDLPFNFETVALYEYKTAFHYIYHNFNKLKNEFFFFCNLADKRLLCKSSGKLEKWLSNCTFLNKEMMIFIKSIYL